MSDIRMVAAMLVGSATLRLSFRDYRKDYIALKAAEVATKIVKEFKSPDLQMVAAHIFAGNYGHTLPQVSSSIIDEAIRDTKEWLENIDQGIEELARQEAQRVAEEQKRIAEEAEAKALEEEAILRKAEQIAAKKAADEAAQRKLSEAASEGDPSSSDVTQEVTSGNTTAPGDSQQVTDALMQSDPTSIAIADLPIPKKQKAELVAAGLVTGADILKYDAEYAAENGIERLKEIGPAARKAILDLLK